MGSLEQYIKSYIYIKHKPKLAKMGFSLMQGGFIVLAFMFSLAAYFLWLSTMYVSYVAALIVATSLLGVALLLAAVRALYVARLTYKSQAQAKAERHILEQELEDILLEYSDDVKELAVEYPKASLALGLAAGYLLSDRVE